MVGMATATVTAAIQNLIEVLSPQCSDRDTLNELREMVLQSRGEWQKAHQLFHRIRQKTLIAERSADARLEAQFLFEEACAKTLYNLSGGAAPFDAHVPFSVVQNAFTLGRQLGIEDFEIVQAIMG
jgi:hypothetical protein